MAVVLSMIKRKWFAPSDDPKDSFVGRNVIVTGANTGVGFEAAAKFHALGAAKVVLAVRDPQKGDAAKASILARPANKSQSGQIEVWQLDMNSYESIQAFALRAKSLDHLDIALINAGVHRMAFAQSQYGWEDDLQVNVISSVYLSLLLLPKLKESKKSNGQIPVLQFTNSGRHQEAKISAEARKADNILDAYNKMEAFSLVNQYSISKLFLMFATNKLAASTSSGDVIITSVCPGAASTDLSRDLNSVPGRIAVAIFEFLFACTAEQGSRTLVSGTVAGEQVHGRFWQHDRVQPVASSVAGEENRKLGERVYNEIIEALAKDIPGVTELAKLEAQ